MCGNTRTDATRATSQGGPKSAGRSEGVDPSGHAARSLTLKPPLTKPPTQGDSPCTSKKFCAVLIPVLIFTVMIIFLLRGIS